VETNSFNNSFNHSASGRLIVIWVFFGFPYIYYQITIQKKTRKMENVFEKVKGFFKGITDLMFAFLTVGILVQVLFGGPVFGMDVVGNVVALIESLGNSGFVGLLAVVVLVNLLNKK
jgi:hypothetical protein